MKCYLFFQNGNKVYHLSALWEYNFSGWQHMASNYTNKNRGSERVE